MYVGWQSACDLVMFSAVEVFVDHGGVYVCFDFLVVYGVGICVDACVFALLNVACF